MKPSPSLFRTISKRTLPFLAVLVAFVWVLGVNASAATLVVDDNNVECPTATFTTIGAAVAAASAGDLIQVCSGTYASPSATIPLTLTGLTIQGVGATRPVVQAVSTMTGGNLFLVTGSGITIDNLEIQKTDTANQVLIAVQADNFTASNNLIYGPNPGGTWNSTGFVSRAFVVSVSNNLVISNNVIHTLRQPAYMSGNATSGGSITGNNVSGTKGWVVEGGNFTFSGNTWGEPQNQECDIALIPTVAPVNYAFYEPLNTLSSNNDNAMVCAQYSAGEGPQNGRASAKVDASAGPGGNGSDNAPYQFINQAFSGTGPGFFGVLVGGTISVAAGTYNEDVVVNKSGVKVAGAGAATTTVSGPIGGGGATFQIAASNVDISGFTITRAGNNTTDWNNAGLNGPGVAIQGLALTGTVIHDNIITGMRTAIDINNSNGHTVRNNLIDFNHTGMIMRNQTDNLVVTENFITNNRTVGVLFLDASGGTNIPLQQALNTRFYNNNISGNWYGQIVDRQNGGSLPAPGTTNLKDFRFNWFGTTSPAITVANSTEPAYSGHIPVAYGGTATAPGGQPDIAGPASANFRYTPLLTSGTDTNIETTLGRGTFGFQGGGSTLVVSPSALNGWIIDTGGAATADFSGGPGTPPLGIGSGRFNIGSDGNDYSMFRTQAFAGILLSDLSSLSYSTYSVSGGTGQQAPVFSIRVDFDNDGVANDVIYFEPVYQNGTYGGDPVPNQCGVNPNCVTYGQWQTWNAFTGGYWANSVVPGGPPLVNLVNYIAAHPGARIASDGLGSVRIFSGGGAGAWDNYVGNTDNVTIGVSGNNVTYNFEPNPLTVTINQASGQADATATSPINFTVTFSEPTSGFTNSDVVLSGAGAVGTTATVTGGPTVYNVAVSGMTANGPVIASINAGAANATVSGAPNTASTSTDNSVYFVATCNTISIPTNITTLTGQQVVTPLNIDDTTGRGILSFTYTLTYNSSVLQYVGIDQLGTLSSTYSITVNSTTPGTLVINGFGTAPLTGAGVLMNIRFLATGVIGTTSAMNFGGMLLNEGVPCSNTTNGLVTVISSTVSGVISYGNAPSFRPVPNVTLNAPGSPNVSGVSNVSGAYSLSGFGPGSYTVTPSKVGQTNGITGFDSSLISQHVVGLITLNANQLLAADVTNNGTVSGLDASYISQWVVNIPNPGITATWKFIPASRNYTNVNTAQTNQDYVAILMGDVTGNWDNLTLRPEFGRVIDPEKAVGVEAASLRAEPGSDVVVPVSVKDLTGKAVTAYQFDVEYDADVLEPKKVAAELASLSMGMTVTSNSPEKGLLRVVVYGVLPIEGAGELVNLRFSAIGQVGSRSPLTVKGFMLNEGETDVMVKDGEVTIERSKGATIRGRMLSPTGETIGGARVTIRSSNGERRSVIADADGNFEFGGLTVGETYLIMEEAKRPRFASRQVSVVERLTKVDMIANR